MRRIQPDANFVPPQLANPNRDLNRVFIAEAPGEQEAEGGQPLIGGAGRIFDRMIGAAHIRRDGLTILNCINCRPPNNVFPTDPDARQYISLTEGHQAVQHCLKAHVYPLLESRVWSRVDLLGGKPLEFIGRSGGGIYQWRGSPLNIELPSGRRLKGMATLHPAALMRDQTMLPVAINDLQKSLEVPPEYHRPFPSLEEVQNFRFPRFAYDIETPRYREMGDAAPVEMVGLCARENFALCVPVNGLYKPELKRIFREAKEIIGHNSISFDFPRLQRDLDIKVSPECKHWDTILVHHLLFPTFPHDLEFVGTQVTDHGNWKADKQCLQIYNCRDTAVTLAAFNVLYPMLVKENLVELYESTQVPLALICNLMHNTGVKIDPSRLREAREKFLAEMAREEKYLPDWLRTHSVPCRKRVPAPEGTLNKSGKPVKFVMVDSEKIVVPWRSTEVKKEYFYGPCPKGLTLPEVMDPKKKTVTTGKVAIAKLTKKLYKAGKESDYKAVKAIGRLNKMDELVSTFAKESMAKVATIHTSFSPFGTSTGRLASSDPNLQNIPEAVRFLYVPHHPGWDWVSVDFSGIENRLQAHFANDTERLKRLDLPGYSEHKYLASKLSGLPMEEIEKSTDPESDYSKAKHVVHGVDRGLGPKKAADMYDMDIKETHEMFAVWKKEIAKTIIWQQRLGEQAAREGVLTNVFGRKLWLWGTSLYTEALSFPPQSTAADILYRCMIALMYERIGWPLDRVKRVVGVWRPLPKPAQLLLSVHDELDFECPHELVPDVVECIKAVMGQPWPQLQGMTFPIAISYGPSWGELVAYK